MGKATFIGAGALALATPAQDQGSQEKLENVIEGIFFFFAKEDMAIRENPAKHITEFLTKVFAK